MTKMTNPRDLFLHELGDVLYAENLLVKTLPKLADEADDGELKRGFEQHLEETRGHVKNVEGAFEALGEKPKSERCPGIEGIKAEHDAFMKEAKPVPAVQDMFLTGAGARTEHYEIAAYTGLVTAAKAMGEVECARLLEANLREEIATLQRLESISKRLATAGAAAMASSR